MITLADARRKADTLLAELGHGVQGGLVVIEDETIEKPYGWVFFYEGKRFRETGDIADAIAGNGPLVVMKATGEVVQLGTARAPDEEVAAFERARGL